MEKVLIPIILFIVTGIVIYLFLSFRHRNFVTTQETVRKLIDKGGDLTPELIQSVGVKGGSLGGKRPPYSDLRRALLFLGFGIAAAIFARFIPEPEPQSVFTGLAFFPIMVGLGYLAVHYLTKREDNGR